MIVHIMDSPNRTKCGGRNPFLNRITLNDYLDPKILLTRDAEMCPLCLKRISQLDILNYVTL